MRAGLVLLGVTAAGWATLIAAPADREAAWALAVVLAGLALAVGVGLPPPEAASGASAGAVPGSRRARIASAVGVGLAIVSVLAGLRRFGRSESDGWGWLLYSGGLFALLAASWRWRAHRRVEAPRVRRSEALLLAGVLLVGAAFRFHLLRSVPYGVWFDEAQNTLVAERILRDPGFRPVFVPDLSQMPALAFYYFAPFVHWIGVNVLAVRVATTVAGLVALLCQWALTRELFGRRAALLAAALLAVSRWHVGFSRFGMAMIFTTVAAPLALWLFVRSQRRESPRDAVLAGLCVGLGMQLYYSMIVLPPVLGVAWIHRLVNLRRRDRSRLLPSTLLFLLVLGAALLAYAPVLQYAARNREAFAQRLRTVSILPGDSPVETARFLLTPSAKRDAVLSTLGSCAVQHLRMFHFEGDHNGRHNLPGEPMLGPITGLLFAVGLVWCLLGIGDPRFSMLLAWFTAVMATGVLSLEFEAPQAARTLGVTPVVTLLAALPLARLGAWTGGADGRSVRDRLARAGILTVLVLEAVISWRLYFDRQRWDPSVWVSWSTPETKIGQVVRDEGADRDVYVPDTLRGGPTETLILGTPLDARSFDRSRDLPLESHGRGAIVFLLAAEPDTVALFRRYYPGAVLEPFGAPRAAGGQDSPILWIARLSEAQLDTLAGWRVEYRRPGRAPVVRRVTSAQWDWREAPFEPPFRARIRGLMRVPREGTYRLQLDADAARLLSLDGEPILGPEGPAAVSVELARGLHEVDLVLDVHGGARSTAWLRWQPPGAPNAETIDKADLVWPGIPYGGLLGSYVPGGDCHGRAEHRQIDSEVGFYFHVLPLARPFAIDWWGSLFAPVPGRYRFSTRSIDGSTVRIDGDDVVVNHDLEREVGGDVELEAGWHEIEVCYQAIHDYSQAYLFWVPPGGERALVPARVLRPPGPDGRLRSAGSGPPDAAGTDPGRPD